MCLRWLWSFSSSDMQAALTMTIISLEWEHILKVDLSANKCVVNGEIRQSACRGRVSGGYIRTENTRLLKVNSYSNQPMSARRKLMGNLLNPTKTASGHPSQQLCHDIRHVFLTRTLYKLPALKSIAAHRTTNRYDTNVE